MIKNFILLHFEITDSHSFENYIKDNADSISKKTNIPKQYFDFTKKRKLQKKFINYTIKQIRHFYKNANIHVICKDKNHPILQKNKKEIILHELDLKATCIDKLNIYGLLDEPSMHIELDVLLVRPFEKHHLETKNPFNVFKRYDNVNHFILTKKQNFPMYNTGIIWIQEPSKDLENEMKLIYKNNFSEKKMFFDIDEFPVSKFIYDNKLDMDLYWEVNHLNERDGYGMPKILSIEEMKKYQSIHYPTTKEIFKSDYKKLQSERCIFI